MPELPDVTVYVERLNAFVVGHKLEQVRLATPFLLRTVEPPLSAAIGRTVREVRRLGKRIVFVLDDRDCGRRPSGLPDDDLCLVVHLMIAGRLRWRERGVAITRKVGLASFDFDNGSLLMTEASPKKRASLHVARAGELGAFDRGGLEPLDASFEDFRAALLTENHTLKRALTDPRLLSGIGNSYSDEILFHARLSPIRRTHTLDDAELRRLYEATQSTLSDWTERLRRETGEGFPEKVTAFREGMAVHGRYGKPCSACGTKIQRIRYADNEVNYCPRCQTGGRLLADRALSRLLHEDWPRTIEELEERRGEAKQPSTRATPTAPASVSSETARGARKRRGRAAS